MSDSFDDAMGFVTAILGVLGIFILIGVLFINVSGMLTMIVLQGFVRILTPWDINYWFMWGLSVPISYQWWYFTERTITEKFPAKKEWCVPLHYSNEEKAKYAYGIISGIIGTIYLVDCFYFKTGIGVYCTRCFFGKFFG
jgi:hypothetical protein